MFNDAKIRHKMIPKHYAGYFQKKSVKRNLIAEERENNHSC